MPGTQATNFPGYIPIPNLHVRKTQDTSKSLGLWAVLKLAWMGIPQASHSSFADPKSRSMQFQGKLATLISLTGRATGQTNHFRFPSTVLLLARWGGPGVWAPRSACRSRLWEPQGLCLANKPYSPFASFSSVLRAASPSTATQYKRANHGRNQVLSMHVQIS